MVNPKRGRSADSIKNKSAGFWPTQIRPVRVIFTLLAFIFISIPGWINAVTGIPFSEWLKEQGIKMPFVSIVLWGVGIGISVFIFWKEKKLAEKDGFKFSWTPWVYIVGFMVFFLWNGLFNHSNISNTFNDLPAAKLVQDVHFRNEQVVVDNKHFIGCEFVNCQLIYLGVSHIQMEHCVYEGCVWSSPKPEINEWIFLSTKFGFMSTNTLVPLDHVGTLDN